MLQLPYPILWPSMATLGSTGLLNLNSYGTAGEGYGIVCYAHKDMVIDKVGWYCSAAAGSPTAEIRIESISATTGQPNGLWATNTNIVTGTLTAVTWREDSLTAAATITAGSIFAVVWKYNSGTSYANGTTTSGWQATAIPYHAADFDGDGTYTLQGSTAGLVCAALGHSTGWYVIEPFLPLGPTNPATLSWSTTSSPTPTHRGCKFQMPFSCRLLGFSFAGAANAGDFDMFLYNGAGSSILKSRSFDGDVKAASVSAERHYLFDTPINLSANTNYRCVIQPTTTTTTAFINLIFADQDLREATPWGMNWQYVTLNSGTWDDSQTDRIPQFRAIIDQIDISLPGSRGSVLGLHPIEQGLVT